MESDLYDLASDLLTTCISALNWTERAYVSNGPPPFECCPQLTVHYAPFNRDYAISAPTPSPAISQAMRSKRGSMNAINLVITVLECVPTVKLSGKTTIVWPDVSDIDAATLKMTSDVWLLWNILQELWRSEQLFGGRCRPMDIGPAQPLVDQGGCGGWLISLRVQLDGYRPV